MEPRKKNRQFCLGGGGLISDVKSQEEKILGTNKRGGFQLVGVIKVLFGR